MAKAEATVKEFVGKIKRDGLRQPAPAQRLGEAGGPCGPTCWWVCRETARAAGAGGPGVRDWGQPAEPMGLG
jgi:hypothetical protein